MNFLAIKKDLEKLSKSLFFMAGATRIELATSGVTGRRSNQTELRPHKKGGRRNRA